MAIATASGISKAQADAAFALIPLNEAACAVASHLPVRKRRNHTVDVESAHAFNPKYLGTQMTELEHAEKLTGESGARPAFNRAIKRIPPGDVELIGKLEASEIEISRA